MGARRLVPAAAALLVSLAPSPAAVAQQNGLTAGNTAFALELHRRLRLEAENVFFSPLSLSETLAMAWCGARGETARQMAMVLHLSSDPAVVNRGFAEANRRIESLRSQGTIDLTIADSLWPQSRESLLPAYLRTLKDFYGAVPTPVDYRRSPDAARVTINRWVENRTHERIRDLLPPDSVSVDTRLVLANAVYFKGKWKTRFEKARTETAPFRAAPGRTVSVPLMHGSPEAGYLEVDGAQVLRLPYLSDGVSLVVILPRKADGLKDLEDRLTGETLTNWLSSLRSSQRKVEVGLPRFRLEHRFQLKRTLSSMGMKDAFDSGKADFSAMSSARPGLFISEGFHKAFVDLNEDGTEAAAATGLVAILVSVPPPSPVFRADHPFLFLIRDDVSGELLFLGSISDPTR